MSKNFFKKNILLIGIISIILFSVGIIPTISVEINQTDRKKIYLNEVIDFEVDGSINPVRINLTLDYDYITRIQFELDYEQINWIPSDFAASDPLENGTVVFVDDAPFFARNITRNDFFFLVCHSAEIIQDDKDPKITHIYGQYTFGSLEFCSIGLPYHYNSSLYFTVQDNLTDIAYAISDFVVLVFGFRYDDTKSASADLTNPFETLNIWFQWFLSMWPLWLITIMTSVVFIFLLKQFL